MPLFLQLCFSPCISLINIMYTCKIDGDDDGPNDTVVVMDMVMMVSVAWEERGAKVLP